MPALVKENYEKRNGPACTGCVHQDNTRDCRELVANLGYSACGGSVWIPDTPEGMAAYIALKLEVT